MDEANETVRPELLIEEDGAVRTLRLNRPEKHNALNRSLTAALLAALDTAQHDESVRALVLCGSGPSFCAGADVTEFAALGDDAGAARERAELTMTLHRTLARIPIPVVGAVNGRALGGGAGLALGCDLLVLADTAVLGYPEVKHGMVAAIVMANLVRQVGRKAAFELVGLAEPIDAHRALQLGLANRVVAAALVEDEAKSIAARLSRYHRGAMAETKRLLYRVADLPLDEALETGREANIRMRGFRSKT